MSDGDGTPASREEAAATRSGRERSGSDGRSAQPEPEWRRRARLAAIFGDALPEQTADDRDEPRAARDGDVWLKEQVPPHHGTDFGS